MHSTHAEEQTRWQLYASLPLVLLPVSKKAQGSCRQGVCSARWDKRLTFPLCFIAMRTYGSSITNSSCTSEALAARRSVHHGAAAWLTRPAPRGASPAPAFQTCSGALSPHSAQLRSIWTCQRRGRPQHAGGPSGLRQRACALQCTTTNYRPCAPRARGPGRALVGHPRAAGQLLDVQLDRDHVRDAVPARLRPVRRRARMPVPQRARAQHAAAVERPARQLRRKRGIARALRPARRARAAGARSSGNLLGRGLRRGEHVCALRRAHGAAQRTAPQAGMALLERLTLRARREHLRRQHKAARRQQPSDVLTAGCWPCPSSTFKTNAVAAWEPAWRQALLGPPRLGPCAAVSTGACRKRLLNMSSEPATATRASLRACAHSRPQRTHEVPEGRRLPGSAVGGRQPHGTLWNLCAMETLT